MFDGKRRSSFVFSLVIVLALLAGLVGCTAPATPAPAAQPTKAAAAEPTKAAVAAPTKAAVEPTKAAASTGGDKVELRITWWGSQARHDRTIKVIEMFQQKYPNIKITYEFAGWDDYWTRLTTQAAGNNLPDIMQQDYAYLAEWTKKGLLAPLDSYIADGTLNMKDVSPASIEGGKVNGKMYAINLGSNSQAMVLDLDAFKKAGVDLPKADWTWAEFEKIAMTLKEKNGVPGMSFGLWNDQFAKNIYLSLGQNFYDPDGTKLAYTDDKPLVDYFNMLLRLQKAKAMISREDEVANKYTVETDPIVKSGAAMTYTNSNQIIAIWSAAGEARNLKMVPLPRVEAKTPTNYFKPSQFFSVTAGSKHPKEAAMFIDYFTNSVEANEVLLAERGVPISSKVRDGLKPKLGKAQLEMFDYIARLEGNVVPLPAPDPAGHPDIVKNVWTPQVVDPVMYGQTTPEKAMVTLRQEASVILAKNKK